MEDQDNSGDPRRAQAAQWFARLKSVPVSRGTLDAFFEWRRQKGNAEAFEEAERFWSDAEKVGRRPSMLGLAQAAMSRGVKQRAPSPRIRRGYLVAAMLVILTLGSTILYRTMGPTGDTIQTAIGERRSVDLEDGSRVVLDTDTRIAVRFREAGRGVVLDAGQADFRVARDRSRPFTVTAGDVVVVATGTRFDVRRLGQVVSVTLIEGGVDVRRSGGDTIRLAPGERWRSDENRRVMVQPVNTASATAWTQGRIVLDGVQLAEAIAEVNRYTDHDLQLDATRYAGERISGSFEAGDTDSFAKAVTALLPLRFEQAANGSSRFVAASPLPEKKNNVSPLG